MNQQSHNEDNREYRHVRYRTAVQSQRDEVSGPLLVARIVYAVLIVGCVGYYMEKALEIVRQ